MTWGAVETQKLVGSRLSFALDIASALDLNSGTGRLAVPALYHLLIESA